MNQTKYLFNLMREKNIRQKDLAELLEIPEATVNNWARGSSKTWSSPELLPKIAQILGTTADYLLTGKVSNSDTLPTDALAVADAYAQASPELRSAVRRVLGLK